MATDDTERMPMTSARLQALLEAYGADPARWPVEQRAAAEALLDTSAEARALRDQARALDGLLDRLPAPEPSAALRERVLADAPTRPRVRRRLGGWRVAAAIVPLAAAAAAVFWVWRADTTGPSQPAEYAIADLGTYTTPTDVWLEAASLDVLGEAPVIGCGTDGLACPLGDIVPEPQSSRGARERRMA